MIDSPEKRLAEDTEALIAITAEIEQAEHHLDALREQQRHLVVKIRDNRGRVERIAEIVGRTQQVVYTWLKEAKSTKA